MLVWMRAAVIIYALFFGLRPFPGLKDVVAMLVSTPEGWAMLLVGTVVGGALRRLLLRDQHLRDPDAARRGRRRLHGDAAPASRWSGTTCR